MTDVIANLLLGAAAIITLMLAVAAVWGITYGVPSVPTPMHVVRLMVDLADLHGSETVFDLGAGDARLLIEAKKCYPSITAIGCEINPAVWLLGKMRIGLLNVGVTFRRRSMFAEDLHDADVVFLYLFPQMMEHLVKKCERELKPGTRIISYMFRLPGQEPVETKVVKGYWGEAKIYVYRWSRQLR